MAKKQVGTLLVSGDIGNIGFYQKNGKAYARRKSQLDGRRLLYDPAFERTRENMQEFTEAAKAGKLLRDAVRPMLIAVKDGTAANRLQAVMAKVKNLDAASARGARNVSGGIADPAARQLLAGFNFNQGAILNSVVYKPYEVDTATGIINISEVLPVSDIIFPQGATHISFKGCWTRIDFATGESEVTFTNVENLARTAPQIDVELTPDNAPSGTGTDFFLLLVAFYQEINGVQYALKNGAYNALSIVAIA